MSEKQFSDRVFWSDGPQGDMTTGLYLDGERIDGVQHFQADGVGGFALNLERHDGRRYCRFIFGSEFSPRREKPEHAIHALQAIGFDVDTTEIRRDRDGGVTEHFGTYKRQGER